MSETIIPEIPYQHLIAVSDLDIGAPVEFTVRPTPDDLTRIAEFIGATAASKTRLVAKLTMHRDGSVDLAGSLGATVQQACVVTFAPVRTRIEEPVERRFVVEQPDLPDEHQMAEDDDVIENLGKYIDLGAILVEDLALALPPFPRAPDAELQIQNFSAPGIDPMTDEDAKPFAALAELRDKLKAQDPE